MSSSVVLPPPLRPTTPIRSPRSTPERHRVEQHPRGVAGHVRGDRLQVDQVLRAIRDGIRRAPAAGATGGGLVRVDDAGAGHRAVRRPGPSGTPRPRPARRRRRSRLSASAQRNAQVGPEPETIPASAPASTPARSVRRSSGAMLTAAACRSLPRQSASWRGSPPATASSTGSTGRSERARPPPRSRSSSPYTAGGGQPAAVQRDHPVLRVPGQHRHDLLAAAGAQRGAAVQREGDVAAQLAASRGELVAGEVELPQRREPDQRGGRVRAAPGHPAGDRDALAQHHPHVRHAGPACSATSSTARQARFVSSVGTSARPRRAPRRPVLGRRDRDLVEQAHRVEDGDQVVVAVGAQRADGQMQVDLGRDAHGDRWGDGGEHPTTLRARRSGRRAARRSGAVRASQVARRGEAEHGRRSRRAAPPPAAASDCAIAVENAVVQRGRQLRDRRPRRSRRPPPGRSAASRACISAAIPALPSTAPTWRVVL